MILAYRQDHAAETAVGLEVHTTVDKTNRTEVGRRSEIVDGELLPGDEDRTTGSTRFTVTRFDYTLTPDQQRTIGPELGEGDSSPGVWLRTGTRWESGNEIATTAYELERPFRLGGGRPFVRPLPERTPT